MDPVATLSERELEVLERQIAGKYMGRVPWSAVIWGLGNCIAFVALFPLVILGYVPLWLGFILATISITASYLPSHEAQHNIIAGRGKPLRWLNELVGHVSTIPLVYPYRVLRATHMEHHAHCNDAAKDPDFGVHAESTVEFWRRGMLEPLFGSRRDNDYAATLERTGQSELMMDAVAFQGGYLVILFGLAWFGYALEAALLWWLPKHLATNYLSYFLSWAPHHPGHEQGRYRDTRGFKSRVGNVLSMGMQYHIVHHLYPRIPLALTPAAYRELKPVLQRKGCELGTL